MTPALLARYPALAEQLPWLPLGEWPTPVSPLAELSARFELELWAKRDDHSGLAYGGNKVRKLEWLLGQAAAQGCRSVVTVGGIGSNHVVATATYARELKLATYAVVVPQPITALVRHNLELARALGVQLVPCPARPLVPLYLAWARRRAERPFVIGPGGSSPRGTLGYVSAGLELAQQIEERLLPEPDEIYVALGSGGSLAGLVLGCALAGLRCRLVGVRVVERSLINATMVELLVWRTRRLLRSLGVAVPPTRMPIVEHRYAGERYGQPTAAALAAVRIGEESAGLPLETTYTAKAFAALLARAEERRRSPSRLLFWSTFNGRDTAPLLQASATPSELPAQVSRWLARPEATPRA